MANPTSVLEDLDTYLARVSEEEEEDAEEGETANEEVNLGDACAECRANACPLMGAVTSGHKGCLKEMLSVRGELDLSTVRSENGATLAHIAARKGDLETLQMLVGAEPSLCEIGDVRGGRSPPCLRLTMATWTACPASSQTERRQTRKIPMARHQYTLHPLRDTYTASRSSSIAAKATRMNKRRVVKHQVDTL